MLETYREQAVAAVQRTVGEADAEDCVQDAMLRLVRRGDLDPGRVRSLLARVATHIAIDRVRSRRREESAMARLRAQAHEMVASPEDIVSDLADIERAMAAIDSLPRRERQVMLMRLSGLSVPETAQRLGLSYKSIEGAYTRARARVRLIIGGILAWLATRRRHRSVPIEEAMVAAAALVFFASPSWFHHVAGGVARGSFNAHSAAAAATAPSQARLGVTAGSRPASGARSDPAAAGAGSGGHRWRYDHSDNLVTTPSATITVPGGPGGGGGQNLVSIGNGYVDWDGHVDGLGPIEQCLAQGPTIDPTLPGSTSPGFIGCDN